MQCQYACVGGLIFKGRFLPGVFKIIFFIELIGLLLLDYYSCFDFSCAGKGARRLLYIISLIVGVVKDSFLGSLDLVYICCMSYSLCLYRLHLRESVGRDILL